ncbi:substrate-binding periplasmic protein [Janthinobacterium sp. RB2R34]|uniref:substrate-binding periplasmic protein n=1 Tax=Janthinobacterium sp. RB2R34 TaxID=3424193 RepID=UPI003F2251FE
MPVRTLLRILLLSLALLSTHVWADERVASPLRVVSFPYPPFMLIDERSKPAGPMVELVSEAFRRVGQPASIELLPLARALLQVETGEAAAMFTVKKTPERVAKYLFSSEPVLVQDYVIFVASDSTLAFRGDLNALAMSSIGVVAGTSYGAIFDAAARQGTFKKLESAGSHDANFRKLLAGRMDAVVCSRAVGVEILRQLQASWRVKISGPPIETTQSYLMFNKAVATPKLVEKFDHAIRTMRKEGLLDTYRKVERP